MKLINVEATFDPSVLEAAISLFDDQARKVREMPGCTHYALYRNTTSDGIAIVQRWTDMAAFEAYRASETFAQLGKDLKPKMSTPPVTTIAEIEEA